MSGRQFALFTAAFAGLALLPWDKLAKLTLVVSFVAFFLLPDPMIRLFAVRVLRGRLGMHALRATGRHGSRQMIESCNLAAHLKGHTGTTCSGLCLNRCRLLDDRGCCGAMPCCFMPYALLACDAGNMLCWSPLPESMPSKEPPRNGSGERRARQNAVKSDRPLLAH